MSGWPKPVRILVRVLVGFVALVLILAAGVAISIMVDQRGAAERLDTVANTTIPGETGGPDVQAYVAVPSAPGPHPVVVMIHEFWGLNPDIVSKADLLAEEGYLVIAPDTFRGRTTGFIPTAIFQVITTPADEFNQDVDAVVAWAEEQQSADSERIGIVGFCFGGRGSLRYSLHNPAMRATAVFYGEPVTDAARLKTLQGPVLGIFGGADSSIPLDSVKAFERGLKQAGVESTVTVYADQPHAFVKNAEGIASDKVQAQAWDEMVRFLGGALQEPAVPSVGATSEQPSGDFYGWAPLLRLAMHHAGHGSPWDGALQ